MIHRYQRKIATYIMTHDHHRYIIKCGYPNNCINKDSWFYCELRDEETKKPVQHTLTTTLSPSYHINVHFIPLKIKMCIAIVLNVRQFCAWRSLKKKKKITATHACTFTHHMQSNRELKLF